MNVRRKDIFKIKGNGSGNKINYESKKKRYVK